MNIHAFQSDHNYFTVYVLKYWHMSILLFSDLVRVRYGRRQDHLQPSK